MVGAGAFIASWAALSGMADAAVAPKALAASAVSDIPVGVRTGNVRIAMTGMRVAQLFLSVGFLSTISWIALQSVAAGQLSTGAIATILTVGVQIGLSIAQLGDDDRAAFMADLGLTKFHRDAVIRAIFYGVGRDVFFTVGEEECRTWSIPRGCEAVEAAGSQCGGRAPRGVAQLRVSMLDVALGLVASHQLHRDRVAGPGLCQSVN